MFPITWTCLWILSPVLSAPALTPLVRELPRCAGARAGIPESGQDSEGGMRASGPRAEFEALVKAYEKAKGLRLEKYREFLPRFRALAERHSGSPTALAARIWILKGTWLFRKEGSMKEKAKVLVDEIFRLHPGAEGLAELADLSYLFSARDRISVMERLMEDGNSDELRAAGMLGLAQALRRKKDTESVKRREKLLKDLKSEFGKLPWKEATYGDIAEAMLRPHPREALGIGRLAPEIEGTDLEGRPMKLSDFRGKVVLLDFWGDW